MDDAPIKANTGAGEPDLTELFKQFDTSGDGFLQKDELKRAFRAIGLMRKGEKFELTDEVFASFDSNGDGKISYAEFTANLHPKTRAKIIEKLDGGWKFDEKLWAASQERHSKWNMEKVFMQFDVDGDGKLTINELGRAFRALGLKKRDGEKLNMDQKMFSYVGRALIHRPRSKLGLTCTRRLSPLLASPRNATPRSPPLASSVSPHCPNRRIIDSCFAAGRSIPTATDSAPRRSSKPLSTRRRARRSKRSSTVGGPSTRRNGRRQQPGTRGGTCPRSLSSSTPMLTATST